jgi:hypothetical protein
MIWTLGYPAGTTPKVKQASPGRELAREKNIFLGYSDSLAYSLLLILLSRILGVLLCSYLIFGPAWTRSVFLFYFWWGGGRVTRCPDHCFFV